MLELSRSSDLGRHPWFPALFLRRTTRAPFAPLPMPYWDFAAQLGNLSDLPGLQLRWYETKLERAAIIKAVHARNGNNGVMAYRFLAATPRCW